MQKIDDLKPRHSENYLPQLDGWRGWAILLVIAFHYAGIILGDSALNSDSAIWLRIANAGNTGVTLFFVMSGFLLSYPFLNARKKGSRVDITRFYISRFFRIVPLYYIAVFSAWLFTGNGIAALKAMLFIPVGFQLFPYSVPWWSLSTEVQFYIILPLVMLGLYFPIGRKLLAVLICLWLGMHTLHTIDPQRMGLPLSLNQSIFGRGFAFLLGGFAAAFFIGPYFAKYRQSQYLVVFSSIFFFISLITLLQWYGLVGQKQAKEILPFYHELEAIAWTGLILCSLASSNIIWSLLLGPAIRHFGKISYSIYLIHIPIQFFVLYPVLKLNNPYSTSQLIEAIAHSFLLFWILSLATYILIEKPFLRLKAYVPIAIGKVRVNPSSV